MSEEIDKYINEAVNAELKDAVKKLLIEGVEIDIIYKVFSRLSREEIDEIEVEASVIRQKNFNREYWKRYYEEHKDNPDDIMVQIHDEAVKEAKKENEAMFIKNMKADNVPIETIQKIFPQYTLEEMEELIIEYEKDKRKNLEIEMMFKYFEKHQDEENAIAKYLADFDENYRRDAQILLIKDIKKHTPNFAWEEYFRDFTEEEIEKI